MIRILCVIMMCAAVAGCGADGEPLRPTANIGVGVSSSGVQAGASVGVRRGPVNVNVSVF